MPDLDDLLSPEIATAAGDAARRPSVASLAARGARRRRRRQGSVLPGVAATVAIIAVGVTQLRGPSVTTPGRAPSSSTTRRSSLPPSTKQSSPGSAAGAVVSAADSRIWSLTVAPGDTGHRLSEWYECLDGPATCTLRRYALATTADSFGSRHVVDLPAVSDYPYDVEVAGHDHFIVSHDAHLVGVADLSGRLHKITISGPAGPATPGEVVSTQGTKKPIAVDPITGLAHPLALPAGTRYLQNVSGRLWASGTSHLAWSDDGGAHWTPVDIPADLVGKPFIPIPTADARTVAMVIGGNQTNTTLPWLDTLRGVAGQELSAFPPPASTVDPRAVAILPDGRLLALIPSWDSWQNGKHNPAGFYVGQDWSHLAPVRMGQPFAHLAYTSVPPVLSVTATGHTVTIYATSPNQAGVLSSTDSGATWRPEAAR